MLSDDCFLMTLVLPDTQDGCAHFHIYDNEDWAQFVLPGTYLIPFSPNLAYPRHGTIDAAKTVGISRYRFRCHIILSLALHLDQRKIPTCWRLKRVRPYLF
jgi:hypothetical protein